MEVEPELTESHKATPHGSRVSDHPYSAVQCVKFETFVAYAAKQHHVVDI